MLTIKHCRGYETVLECQKVEYWPPQAHEDGAAFVEVTGLPDHIGGRATFSDGKVYVMNDKGRTIATYHLDIDNAAEPAKFDPVRWLALYTACPDKDGSDSMAYQVAYPGYERIPVSSKDWQPDGRGVRLKANMEFPQAQGGETCARFFGVCEEKFGGALIASGPVAPPINIGGPSGKISGVTPILTEWTRIDHDPFVSGPKCA